MSKVLLVFGLLVVLGLAFSGPYFLSRDNAAHAFMPAILAAWCATAVLVYLCHRWLLAAQGFGAFTMFYPWIALRVALLALFLLAGAFQALSYGSAILKMAALVTLVDVFFYNLP